jgi:hypothetical protein
MTMYHIESFIEKGKYSEMKQLEFVMSGIKENIRAFQENIGEKRIEWKEIGVVSKFVSHKEYNWDLHAIKVLFFDLGILIKACVINNEKLNEEQLATLRMQVPKMGETYVRYSPNKQLFKVNTEDNTCFAEMTPQQQLVIWRELRGKHEKLIMEWDMVRNMAKFSAVLIKNKRVTFDFGAISLLESKPKYSAENVYNTFGGEAFLVSADVDISKIDELSARGFLTLSLINKYRTIVNVNLKFFLMEMEKEKTILEFNSQRLKILSNLSITKNLN